MREYIPLDIIKLCETNTKRDVARMCGLSQSTISAVLKKSGIRLKRGRINECHTPIDVDYFHSINNRDKAYWLGYICADGHITKNGRKLTLVSKDKDVIINFKAATRSGYAISVNKSLDKRTKISYISYSTQIANHTFIKNVIQKGVTTNKTSVLNFPPIKEKYYPYFIAGLFDGDGSVSFKGKNKQYLRISLISTKNILSFIGYYLQKQFGIKILPMRSVSENCDNVWKTHLYKDAYEFLDFIYQDKTFPYYLKRKYDKYVNYKETHPA